MKSMLAWAGALVGAMINRPSMRDLEIQAAAPLQSWAPPMFDTWSASSSDGIPAFPARRSYLASRREARRRRNARRS